MVQSTNRRWHLWPLEPPNSFGTGAGGKPSTWLPSGGLDELAEMRANGAAPRGGGEAHQVQRPEPRPAAKVRTGPGYSRVVPTKVYTPRLPTRTTRVEKIHVL